MDTEYAEFLEKVKRTIYVDNLSPQVSESVVKAAFDQFGNVTNVEFIPLYMQPKGVPIAALVEMENSKQAQQIISQMDRYPFMIAGMPRPVRAKAAELEMFDDRPRKPGRRIHCCWLGRSGPEFEVAKKIKFLVRKHTAEASFLLEQQLREEEKLANQQTETLKTHYKKLELIEGIQDDGTAQKLAWRYLMDRRDF